MESTNTGFTFDLPKGNSSIIKVIGVGGGGNNALKHMYERGIHGVDFVICNTDAQTLDNNPVANKVQLGVSITEGLGAGADPEVGEKAAIESIDDIKAALGQNTKMVFITAGMGGGTGTGAAPVVAKIAKEMGILTVGIVTVPFSFEGRRRLEQAETGLEKLRNNVDSLIVINNDKLRQQFGNLGFKQGFSKADEVLTNAAKGMAEVITAPFQINIDFRDAKSVLENSGTALMSTGIATGEKRAEEAVRKALDSPLLNDNKITGAKDVLLLILSGTDEANEATMDEIGLINDYVQAEAGGDNNANIIFGVGTDDELGDAIKVLVIATGFAKEHEKNPAKSETIKISLTDDAGSAKSSPFKTHETRQPQSGETKNVFRLDDEDDFQQPGFPTNSVETHTAAKQDFKFSDHEETLTQPRWEGENNEQEQPKNTVPNLFSFNFDEELKAEGFKFETTEQPQQTIAQDEEKPVEFSFVVNAPKEDFPAPKMEIRQEPVQKTEAAAPRTDFPKQELPKTEFPKAEVKPEPVQEIPVEREEVRNEVIFNAEFTFIDKTSDDKVMERRNKLKEFNSRYQNLDHQDDFETVPAFRRKNISIDEQNPSEQNITSFLSESNGQFRIRENRFLNKDVD